MAGFRHDGADARNVVLVVRRALRDEKIAGLPTRSRSRKAMRRWERNLSHLENYFDWEMHEYKNQARFHSPARLLPNQMKMVFRGGSRSGPNELKVRSLGLATVELLEEKLQPSLYDELAVPPARPIEMLALVAEYKTEVFGAGMADTVTLYVAHVVGLGLKDKILKCSEVIEIGKWDLNEGTSDVVELPPSRPIVPTVRIKPRHLQEGI